MAGLIHRDAAVLAFADAFAFLACGTFLAACVALFTGRARANMGPQSGGH